MVRFILTQAMEIFDKGILGSIEVNIGIRLSWPCLDLADLVVFAADRQQHCNFSQKRRGVDSVGTVWLSSVEALVKKL